MAVSTTYGSSHRPIPRGAWNANVATSFQMREKYLFTLAELIAGVFIVWLQLACRTEVGPRRLELP